MNYGSFFVWLFLYASTWLIWYKLVSKGKDYGKTPIFTILYFVGSSILHLLLFTELLLHEKYITQLALLPITLLLVLFLNFLINKHFDRLYTKLEIGSFSFLQSGILPKHFEILFQQISFLVLFILINQVFTFPYNIFVTTASFFILHTPLVFLITKNWAIYYTLSSLFGALIFSSLLFYFKFGLLIAYAIHTLFYTITAGILWKQSGKFPQMK